MKEAIMEAFRWLGKGARRVYGQGMVLLIFFASSEVLAAGGPPATKLVNVADTRNLAPGLTKWVADIYNTNLWLFGLVVIVTMAAMGLILGLGFDKLISLTGIDLGKLEHHE